MTTAQLTPRTHSQERSLQSRADYIDRLALVLPLVTGPSVYDPQGPGWEDDVPVLWRQPVAILGPGYGRRRVALRATSERRCVAIKDFRINRPGDDPRRSCLCVTPHMENSHATTVIQAGSRCFDGQSGIILRLNYQLSLCASPSPSPLPPLSPYFSFSSFFGPQLLYMPSFNICSAITSICSSSRSQEIRALRLGH